MIKELLFVFLCILFWKGQNKNEEENVPSTEDGLVQFLVFFAFLWVFFSVVSDCCCKKKKIKDENAVSCIEDNQKGFHQVGFCTSCVRQTRLPMHCDGCGGHDRSNIKQHFVMNGQKDYICTKCFHLARYSHHCDTCGAGPPSSRSIEH